MSHSAKQMALRPNSQKLDKQMESLDRAQSESAEFQGRSGQDVTAQEAEAALNAFSGLSRCRATMAGVVFVTVVLRSIAA